MTSVPRSNPHLTPTQVNARNSGVNKITAKLLGVVAESIKHLSRNSDISKLECILRVSTLSPSTKQELCLTFKNSQILRLCDQLSKAIQEKTLKEKNIERHKKNLKNRMQQLNKRP
jgi:hypothetical protein